MDNSLELVKISNFPESTDVKEWIVVSDAMGNAYKVTRDNFKAFLGTVQSIAPRSIAPTDPEPTLDGVYIPTVTQNEAGTPIVYTNTGGLTVNTAEGGEDYGKAPQLIKNGSLWVKVATPLPMQDISDLATKEEVVKYLVKDWVTGTAYNKGEVVYNLDSLFYAKINTSTTAEPGVSQTYWGEKIKQGYKSDGIIIGDQSALVPIKEKMFREAFVDIQLFKPIPQDKLLYIYSLSVSATSKKVSVFFGTSLSSSGVGDASEITFRADIDSIDIKSGLHRADIIGYLNGEVEGWILIDLDRIEKTTNTAVTAPEFKNFSSFGIRPIFYRGVSGTDDVLRKKSMYYKVGGDSISIVSKFDSQYDLKIVFSKGMANELMTFTRVGLVPNSNSDLNPKSIDSLPTVILNTTSSDNIGPIKTVSNGWIGGNHTFQNDGITHTADTISHAFYGEDGEHLSDEMEGYTDKLVVEVLNNLYDPVSLGIGNQVPIIKENVVYKVSDGNIEVNVSHSVLDSINIESYYGMQGVFSNSFNEVFVSNSIQDNYIPYESSGNWNAGSLGDYPDIDAIFTRNSITKFTQAMVINRNFGIGKGSEITAGTAFAFKTGQKIYFYLIRDKSFSSGDVYSWSGTYRWFNQDTQAALSSGSLSAFKYKLSNIDLVRVDMKGAGQQSIIKKEWVGSELELVKSDGSIDFTDFCSPAGIYISTEGKSSIVIKEHQ